MLEKLVVLGLIFVLFLAVWRAESGWRIVFTPFFLAMYFEFARIFPAFFFAERYSGISSSYPLWVAFAAYASLLAGFFAWYCLPESRPAQVLSLSARNTPLRLDSLDSGGVLVLALTLCALGLFYFGGLPVTVQSTLSLLTSGGDADLARLVSEQRLELTKGAYFGGQYKGQGLVTEIQQVGWTLICIYALLRHLEMRTKGSLLFLLATVLGAWVFVGGLGSRAPLLNILICMLAAYSLRQPMPLRALAVAVVAVLFVAIALSLYSSKMYQLLAGALGVGEFFSRALVAIAERTLIGNGINDVYAIEFVRTGALEVAYGSIHLRDVISAIPGIQYGQPLAYKLYHLVNVSAHGTTFRSGTYLMDVFVDFYWAGVIVVFFLVGVVLAVTQRWLLRASADPWSISVAVVVGFGVMNMLQGGPVALAATIFVLVTLWIYQRIVRLLLREIAIASGAIKARSANPSSHA